MELKKRFSEGYGRGGSKKAKRTAWMKKFDDEVARLNYAAKSRQDYWDTATHLFFQNMDPKEAAARVAKLKSETFNTATLKKLEEVRARLEEAGRDADPKKVANLLGNCRDAITKALDDLDKVAKTYAGAKNMRGVADSAGTLRKALKGLSADINIMRA